MKTRLTTLAALIVAGIVTIASAQTHQELFLFSQNNLAGNARFVSMGGAFGALGANYGVASTNPAGLGLYTRSEASAGVAFGVWNSTTTYSKNYASDNREKSGFDVSFHLHDLHYLFSSSNARFQFAVGVNRLNDFNAQTVIEGRSNNSFTNSIAANADGVIPDHLTRLTLLAYNGWLIDRPDTTRNIYSPTIKKDVLQRQTTETRGGLTEIAFSFSGNIQEKFYIGATIGIPILDYNEKSTLTEKRTPQTEDAYNLGFTDFVYSHNYDVNGTGVNLKLGVIYKPINSVRIGLAFHTPTYFSINQTFERKLDLYMSNVTDIGYGWDGLGFYYGEQEEKFRYKYFTPAKGLFSLGFVIGTYGVIGLEGELLSYRSIRMISDNDLADKVNDDIRSKYQKISGTVKFGTEWRVSFVSLRLGYNFRSNPYVDKQDNLWSSHIITGGIGVRFNKSLSLDFGVVHTLNPETYYPYYLDNPNSSLIPDDIRASRTLYALTFNVRF
ncbi:MAG: hypothetical protein LBQ31_00445 [Bacteroidales bacterium]|jgi:hypothetical protein|nr:hypothetical protein [Bacteroidales bacterium]